MRRLTIIFALTLGLIGCATPYGAIGALGGVNAESMGPDVYRIRAKLNGFSDESRAQDFLLLKAADTAKAAGAIGFQILDERDTSKSFAIVTPGYSTTTASAYATGNSVFGHAYTTTIPGSVRQGIKPGGTLLIRLVREPVAADLSYLRADDIEASIGPRLRRSR